MWIDAHCHLERSDCIVVAEEVAQPQPIRAECLVKRSVACIHPFDAVSASRRGQQRDADADAYQCQACEADSPALYR